VKNCLPRSLTSLLKEISKERDIPISTLKFNARVLRELGLIKIERESNSNVVKLTELGELVLDLIKDDDLDEIINEIREKVRKLRKKLYKILKRLNNSHLESSASLIDILLALFMKWTRIDHIDPKKNVLILSKGHAAPALYLVLSEFGYIPENELDTLGQIGSRLQTHPCRGLPFVHISTGSLGQGLSIGCGLALADRMRGMSRKIYVILGDGELDEGQIWEAAATAANYRLSNLIAIIDRNYQQLNGSTEKVKKKEPLRQKWRSFGWKVIETNAQDYRAFLLAISEAEMTNHLPAVVIARRDYEMSEKL